MKNLALFSALLLVLLIACKNDPNTGNNTNETEDSVSVANDTIITPKIKVGKDDVVNVNPEELVEKKDVSELNSPQKVVQNLLAYCTKKNYEEAAKILAYLGDDESRLYRDHFNYANSSEKSTVVATCDVIANWLGESESYEFITFEESMNNGMNVASVEVMFKKQNLGVNRRFFDLIETDKGYLLISLR